MHTILKKVFLTDYNLKMLILANNKGLFCNFKYFVFKFGE